MISFIITAKNEPLLDNTIKSIKDNAVTDIEILAEEDDGRGQRAMLNKLAQQSNGDILCKVDAHCIFAPNFDADILQDFTDNCIIAPQMFPLNPETMLVDHQNRMSNFAIDSELVMQHVPPVEDKVTETMCLQGSFFMLTKANWFNWNICDESLGSWGNQGCEIGLKAWYNSGKCVTTKKTYYGHLFRHSDKEFPYDRNQAEIDDTHNKFKQQFLDNRLGWLVKKFNYPCDWTEDKVKILCKPFIK